MFTVLQKTASCSSGHGCFLPHWRFCNSTSICLIDFSRPLECKVVKGHSFIFWAWELLKTSNQNSEYLPHSFRDLQFIKNMATISICFYTFQTKFSSTMFKWCSRQWNSVCAVHWEYQQGVANSNQLKIMKHLLFYQEIPYLPATPFMCPVSRRSRNRT